MLASTGSASVRWLSLSKPMDALKQDKKTSLTDYRGVQHDGPNRV